MVNITMKPNAACVALPCAPIQGAALSRLHVETVVVLAGASTQFKGGAVDSKYGGQGSRAWSPPV